jgi:hypothetical protein
MAELPKNLSEYAEQALGADAVKTVSSLFGTQAIIGDAIAMLGGETGDRRMQQDGAAIYGQAIRGTLDALAPDQRDAFIAKAKQALGENGEAVAAGLKTYFQGKNLASQDPQAGGAQELKGLQEITHNVVPLLQQAYDTHRQGRAPGTVGADGSDEAIVLGPKAKLDRAIADYASAMNARTGGNDWHFGDLQLAASSAAESNIQQHLDALAVNPADLLKVADSIKKEAPKAANAINAIAQTNAMITQGAAAMTASHSAATSGDIDKMVELAEKVPVAKPRTTEELRALRTEVENTASLGPERSQAELMALAMQLKKGPVTPEKIAVLEDKQAALIAVETYQDQTAAAAIAQLPGSMKGRNLNGELGNEIVQLKSDIVLASSEKRPVPTVADALAGLGFHSVAQDALRVTPPLTTPAAPPASGRFQQRQ